MKLSQLIESFVISNDEFEDYLNRATEQLTQELQTGKNPRDAVHDLALTFADQHNKSYDAYTRMSDSLSARMHTLELDGSTSTEIAPADMMNGPEMSDMSAEPEMMTDPMGDMEMDVPAQDEMPGDSDMEDYAAVMDNEPEVEESVSEGRMKDSVIHDSESMSKEEFAKKHGKELADDMYESVVSEKRWKQTSMSPQDAIKQYGKENVKVKKGALRNGDDMVEVFVESMNEALETETVKTKVGERPRGPGWSLKRSGQQRNEPTDTWERKFKRVGKPTGLGESDDDEKARQRAFAKADEPERGEKAKKVSLKKAPWEESVNEAAECKYCGGDCPNDEEHACDGYLGDIDGLYEAKASVLDQLQSIVADKQNMPVKFDDGQMKVDLFTASAITQVYDKVNDDNKAKIEKMLNTRTGLMSIAKVAMGALKEGKLETDGRNRGSADLKPSQIQKLDKTGKNPTMRRYVNKKLATAAKMNKDNDPGGEKKGLGPAVVDKKKAQDKADKRQTNEAEGTTEYGIVRYPDTAISYIKRTENGWEHIFDKSYGFEGPVDKADLQYAKKIKAEKVPGRLRDKFSSESVEERASRIVSGAFAEASKPDFLDVDGDGDKKEPMKKATQDKKSGKKGMTDKQKKYFGKK